MLLSFRFANHQSFRDEQQLNLMPAFPADHGDLGEREPLGIAGVFGANASGKSNMLNALSFLRRLVQFSDREVEPGAGVLREPFRLVREVAAQPSRYVVDLLLDDERVTYGVTLDDTRILEEWLVRHVRSGRYSASGRATVVFERTGDEFRWGSDYSARDDLRVLADITAPTALFMTTAARARIRDSVSVADGKSLPVQLHSVYSWFAKMLLRGSAVGPVPGMALATEVERNPDRLAALLNAADFGIAGIELESLDADEPSGNDRRYRGRPSRLLFRHHGADDGVMLDIRSESRGTLQLLDLGSAAVRVLDRGGMLAVDEIDASLHPLLTARLIGLFRTVETNPRRAQLLFTSHDATLLGHLDGEPIVKRDEIWFTEKNRDGQSALYGLAEFKPRRNGENWERRYLNGAYGAVPELSIDLFELALRARGDFDASDE